MLAISRETSTNIRRQSLTFHRSSTYASTQHCSTCLIIDHINKFGNGGWPCCKWVGAIRMATICFLIYYIDDIAQCVDQHLRKQQFKLRGTHRGRHEVTGLPTDTIFLFPRSRGGARGPALVQSSRCLRITYECHVLSDLWVFGGDSRRSSALNWRGTIPYTKLPAKVALLVTVAPPVAQYRSLDPCSIPRHSV